MSIPAKSERLNSVSYYSQEIVKLLAGIVEFDQKNDGGRSSLKKTHDEIQNQDSYEGVDQNGEKIKCVVDSNEQKLISYQVSNVVYFYSEESPEDVRSFKNDLSQLLQLHDVLKILAKKDLAKASEAFLDAVNRKPKTNVDRRIIELSQLALGRVFYEREQPSKSVDWYLAIDRRSDLFSDALFEAAWVYVKSKQVDKALSALELLSAQDPLAQKTPTVRILEGNLRVRKAQLLRQALLTGLEANGDPADEYIKAEALFRDTKGQYGPSHAELRRVLDEKIDPALYLAQVTGRDSETFAVSAQMPEIAASWVRDEGNVGQLVTVEGDLGDIQANIADGERTIARLEAMLAIPHFANAYPLLAERRARGHELVEQVM